MATQMGDFVEILLRRGIVSPDQVSEAEQMARNKQAKLSDCLVQLGYVTGEEVTRALAPNPQPQQAANAPKLSDPLQSGPFPQPAAVPANRCPVAEPVSVPEPRKLRPTPQKPPSVKVTIRQRYLVSSGSAREPELQIGAR